LVESASLRGLQRGDGVGIRGGLKVQGSYDGVGVSQGGEIETKIGVVVGGKVLQAETGGTLGQTERDKKPGAADGIRVCGNDAIVTNGERGAGGIAQSLRYTAADIGGQAIAGSKVHGRAGVDLLKAEIAGFRRARSDGERGGVAGDGTNGIGDGDGEQGTVVDGADSCGVVLGAIGIGDGGAIFAPLVGDRCGSGSYHGESAGLPHGNGLIGRLRDNLRGLRRCNLDGA